MTVRPCRTLGQRHRFKRNVALYAAHKAGMTERDLADAFLLARSRIHRIITEMRALDPSAAPSRR